jgi:putative membrane protein
MATDLVLAIFHHFLAFLLASVLATEWALIRPGLGGRNLALLGRLDTAYGGIAGTLIAVGILRVLFGLKGWEYYVYNTMFWAKMVSLVAVGMLSMGPTARIVRWRRAAADPAYTVPDAEIETARSYIKVQIVGFALILTFAAAMARGVFY